MSNAVMLTSSNSEDGIPNLEPAQPPISMRRHFYLMDNPFAGHGTRRLVADVSAALGARGAKVVRLADGRPARARAEIERAAAQGECDALVAAGGDGTIRRAAALLLGTSVPLGVIPRGTGNVLACEAGLPRLPHAIAALLTEGEIRPVPVGTANGEPFLLMVGAGFDGRVIAALDHGLKSRVGKLAYAPPVLQALVPPASPLVVTLDGARHYATWAVITKSRCYGGRFVIAEAGGVEKPGLLAVLIDAMNPFELAGTLAAGTLARQRNVRVIPCAEATIEAVEPVPVQIDGDAFGSTPVTIAANQGHVPMILPPPVQATERMRLMRVG
jgi:diacylglycerol kinase family enzyme